MPTQTETRTQHQDIWPLIQLCPDDSGLTQSLIATYSLCATGYINRAYRIAIYPILLVVGIFGQLITIKIFISLKNWKSTCRIYFSTMAVSDLVYILGFAITEWTGEGLDYITNGALRFKPENFSSLSCKLMRYIWHSSVFVSYWTLVAYSVERVLAIWYPLLTIKWISTRTAKIICAIICIIGALLYSPFISAFYKLFGEDRDFIDKRWCYLAVHDLPLALLIFVAALGLLASIILPPTSLLITNLLLIRKLISHSKEQVKLKIQKVRGKRQISQIKSAKDLVVLSFITTVIAFPTFSWLPAVIFDSMS